MHIERLRSAGIWLDGAADANNSRQLRLITRTGERIQVITLSVLIESYDGETPQILCWLDGTMTRTLVMDADQIVGIEEYEAD